tara:strand:- start:374 stop:808 length:435 start_codon:yes stop_codon:yes gene_type:complete
MALSFTTIHSLIVAKMNSMSGFKESRYPVEYFTRTTNPLTHLGYSVSVSSSGNGGRQRYNSGAGVAILSTVVVLFAFRLRPTDAYPTDYKLSLDKEEQVILKLLSAYTGNSMEIQFVGSERTIPDSMEYSIHNLTFNVIHYIKE